MSSTTVSFETILDALESERGRANGTFFGIYKTARLLHEYIGRTHSAMTQEVSPAEFHRFSAAFAGYVRIEGRCTLADMESLQFIVDNCNRQCDTLPAQLEHKGLDAFDFFRATLNPAALDKMSHSSTQLTFYDLVTYDPWSVVPRRVIEN